MTSDFRAAQLWARLFGLFGADAVTRKFGAKPPPEWERMIATLKDYELDRGVRRLTYGGKAYVPSLPEFLKACRSVQEDADLNVPGANVPRLEDQGDSRQMDPWDVAANSHLLGHLLRLISKREPVPKCPEQMAPYLEAKAYWAQMMRDAQADGTAPDDAGRAWWAETLANADIVCADIRAAAQRSRAA